MDSGFELEGSYPTCWPGGPGRPLGIMPACAGLKGAPPSRRGRLDGDGALSAEPGDDWRARLPSRSEGSRCI